MIAKGLVLHGVGKPFMIMERTLGGRVADCSANVLRDTVASCVTRVDRSQGR